MAIAEVTHTNTGISAGNSATFNMNYEVVPAVLPHDTLFIHGNLASNAWWQPAVSVWKTQAKPGLEGRMIMAEWRGCGQSSAPAIESDLHPKNMAADYIELLKNLGIKKCSLVGHSTGGLIGLYALLLAPEMFDSAVLLDPVAATGIQFGPEMYDAFTQMSKDRAFCEAVMGGTIHNNDANNPLFQKLVDDAFGVAPLIWHGIPKALYSVNLKSELKQIKQPVLVLHGEHDSVLPMQGSVDMAQDLGNGQFFKISGHGHSTNVEDPKLFVSLVDNFLFQRN